MPLEFPDWPLVGPNASSAVALVAIAVGLVTCFAGYRLFRVILALYGAALGALVGVAVGHGAAPGVEAAPILGAVVGGLAGALLFSAFYFVGVFVVGAIAGLIIGDAVGLSGAAGELGRTIAALVGGVAALLAQRLVITVGTAMSGAWSAIGGAVALFGLGPSALLDPFTPPPSALWRQLPEDLAVLVWVVLSALGIVVQWSRGEPERPPVRRGRG